MVIEKAKRLVEHRRDVVILLDSITASPVPTTPSCRPRERCCRAASTPTPLQKPKRFFGAARNIEEGAA